MKRAFVCIGLILVLTACNSGQPVKATLSPQTAATEIPCQGVQPRGLRVGMQAYVSLDGSVFTIDLFKEPGFTEKSGSVVHHIRVELQDGPKLYLIGVVADRSPGWW